MERSIRQSASNRNLRLVKWTLGSFILLLALAFAGLQFFFAASVAPVEPFVPTKAEREAVAFYAQPESWFLEHLQGPRETVDGQTIDPKLQYMMEQSRPVAPWIWRTAPLIFSTPWGRGFIRHGIDREWRLYTKVTPEMARVDDRIIEGRRGPIPIRIYRPKGEGVGPLPVLVYHHGGGWIFASIASHDRVSRLLANEAKAIVLSVNYRLAPEHRYPAASDDGEDSFLWARANAASFGGDPAKVGVGGDSAGGHVAINIAQRQVKAGKPVPAAMLLFYPGAGLPQDDPSYRLFGKGYALDSAFIEFILPRVFEDYRRDRIREADEFMNPVSANSLAGLPPTIVATAGFDILRDSGRRFADRLEEDGVPVRYTNYSSLTHSFLQFSAVVKDADTASTESARLFGESIRNPARLLPAP
ncbi:alpha/beta hydrolase [Sandaracinobacter sp. RS1-74]|uniref:alpha/beta hydrolase n=1 Tax=Sandaracinobacteroides sayramensis TaxID=2913411 RepID=UPI001EDC293F|nr:alpha/beta hydrolase [Sandaracinobacteroides sayramensis]MCG2840175.1 alpha/beta hydrolase [Sandaracinobacteroides sayramensis]